MPFASVAVAGATTRRAARKNFKSCIELNESTLLYYTFRRKSNDEINTVAEIY
jgi:hypothetical protein